MLESEQARCGLRGLFFRVRNSSTAQLPILWANNQVEKTDGKLHTRSPLADGGCGKSKAP